MLARLTGACAPLLKDANSPAARLTLCFMFKKNSCLQTPLKVFFYSPPGFFLQSCPALPPLCMFSWMAIIKIIILVSAIAIMSNYYNPHNHYYEHHNHHYEHHNHYYEHHNHYYEHHNHFADDRKLEGELTLAEGLLAGLSQITRRAPTTIKVHCHPNHCHHHCRQDHHSHHHQGSLSS